MDISSISPLITALRNAQAKDAITPESLGYILQLMADQIGDASPTNKMVQVLQNLNVAYNTAGEANLRSRQNKEAVEAAAQTADKALAKALTGGVRVYWNDDAFDRAAASVDDTLVDKSRLVYNPKTNRLALRFDSASGAAYCNNWNGVEDFGTPDFENGTGVKPHIGFYYCTVTGSLRYINGETSTEYPQSWVVADMAKERLFDDMWSAATGADGSVDHSNIVDASYKPYGVYGHWFTYAEAMRIFNAPRITYNRLPGFAKLLGGVKSLLLASKCNVGEAVTLDNAFRENDFEVLCLCGSDTSLDVRSMQYAFYGCSSLTEVKGVLDLSECTSASQLGWAFSMCEALKEVRLKNLKTDLWLGDASELSQESLQYIVDNAANNSTITVTVHPQVLIRSEEIMLAAESRRIIITAA